MFGVSRAISRKNSEIQGCNALIIDLARVTHLGVSSALALEESIKDMLQAGKNILIVHSGGQPMERMRRLGVLDQLAEKNLVKDRRKALEIALYTEDDQAAPA